MKNQTLILALGLAIFATAAYAFDCPQDNGYFRHPSDHHKFFFCVNGREYEYTCPPGTVWNQAGHRCDFTEGPLVEPGHENDDITTEAPVEIPKGTRKRHTQPPETTEASAEETTTEEFVIHDHTFTGDEH